MLAAQRASVGLHGASVAPGVPPFADEFPGTARGGSGSRDERGQKQRSRDQRSHESFLDKNNAWPSSARQSSIVGQSRTFRKNYIFQEGLIVSQHKSRRDSFKLQICRSTSFSLSSAIASEGLRLFGQALAQ